MCRARLEAVGLEELVDGSLHSSAHSRHGASSGHGPVFLEAQAAIVKPAVRRRHLEGRCHGLGHCA